MKNEKYKELVNALRSSKAFLEITPNVGPIQEIYWFCICGTRRGFI